LNISLLHFQESQCVVCGYIQLAFGTYLEPVPTLFFTICSSPSWFRCPTNISHLRFILRAISMFLLGTFVISLALGYKVKG